MKKSLISLVGSIALAATSAFGAFGVTGQPTPLVGVFNLTANVPTALLTNNITVVSANAVTASGSGIVSLYDQNNTNAPYYGTNFVTGSYINTATFATNYVTSYVGYNGYTNWYTNAGQWTYFVTNAAATNALSPQVSIALLSGVIGQLNSSATFQLGVTAYATTNTTLILYYLPNK